MTPPQSETCYRLRCDTNRSVSTTARHAAGPTRMKSCSVDCLRTARCLRRVGDARLRFTRQVRWSGGWAFCVVADPARVYLELRAPVEARMFRVRHARFQLGTRAIRSSDDRTGMSQLVPAPFVTQPLIEPPSWHVRHRAPLSICPRNSVCTRYMLARRARTAPERETHAPEAGAITPPLQPRRRRPNFALIAGNLLNGDNAR
jgi:hypothetical protein